MREKYQGKEIETTIQAPDNPTLQRMITGMQDYAAKMGLEPIEVLMSGSDPDGGFKAVIIAHNFNPITWVEKKWRGRGGGLVARETRRAESLAERTERMTLETKYRQQRAELETQRAQSAEALAAAKAAERAAAGRARRAAAKSRAESAALYRERITGAAAAAQQMIGIGVSSVGATIAAPVPERKSLDILDTTLP